MKDYRLTLTLRSSLGTPLAADTVFGHLCWGLVYHEGTAALESFLVEMDGPSPPLLISDPFPAGQGPMPALPLPAGTDALVNALVADSELRAIGDRFDAADALKRVGRRRGLPHAVWSRVADRLSMVRVVREVLGRPNGSPVAAPSFVPVAHNTIDRRTGGTLAEGGLYFQDEGFVGGPTDFDVYVRTAWSAARVREVFEWGLATGYGRDAGTGKGHLEVGEVVEGGFPAAAEPNAVMTLGPCAPAAEDPTDGWWQTLSRFGKLGGPWAKLPQTNEAQPGNTPFKHPVIFLAAGAVLRCDTPPAFVGRMVGGVHPTRETVRQYGRAVTVPVRLDLEEDV